MSFSDGMKKRRKQLKLSQMELSRLSSVPQSTISAVEKGVRTPTEETMQMIAKGLSCGVGDLLGENEKTAIDDGGLKKKLAIMTSDLPDQDVQRVIDFVAGLRAARKP